MLATADLAAMTSLGLGQQMYFEANRGQFDPSVDFVARGSGYQVFLQSGDAWMTLSAASNAPSPSASSNLSVGDVAVQLPRATDVIRFHPITNVRRSAILVHGDEPLAGNVNYLAGEASNWITDVPTFGRVTYDNVYPGIDLTYRGHDRQLEYDFTVRPGAAVDQIRIEVEGAKLSLADDGSLQMRTPGGIVLSRPPHVYQVQNGSQVTVDGRYQLDNEHTFHFELGSYDHSLDLVIDPVVVYSTYLGGGDGDRVTGVTSLESSAIPSGDVWVTGTVDSPGFPVRGGLQPLSFSGAGRVAFVGKFNYQGELVYMTYLGNEPDHSGETVIDGFQVGGPPNGEPVAVSRSDQWRAVNMEGTAIAVNVDETPVIVGTATVFDFEETLFLDRSLTTEYTTHGQVVATLPLRNAVESQPHHGTTSQLAISNYGVSGFIAKLNREGNGLIFSSYITGAGTTASDFDIRPTAVSITPSISTSTSPRIAVVGNATKVGENSSPLLDIFTAMYEPTGENVFKSIVSGSGFDFANDVAVDDSNRSWIVGATDSPNLATTLAFTERRDRSRVTTRTGESDAYLLELDEHGALISNVRWGGTSNDIATAVEFDSRANRAIVAGYTDSIDYILTDVRSEASVNPRDNRPGRVDGFVAIVNGPMVVTGLFGGSGDDRILAMDYDPSQLQLVVAGTTTSVDLPVVDGSQKTLAGGQDAFVARQIGAALQPLQSTYLGGRLNDVALSVAFNARGVVVGGYTSSQDFPVAGIESPWQGTFEGINNRREFDPAETNGFLTQLRPSPHLVAYPLTSPFEAGSANDFRIALFEPANTLSPLDNYIVTIDWGDGSPIDRGSLTKDRESLAHYVSGSHTYAVPGSYPVNVSVYDSKYDILTGFEQNVSRASGSQVAPAMALVNDSLRMVAADTIHGVDGTGGLQSERQRRAGLCIPGSVSPCSTLRQFVPEDTRDHQIADGTFSDGLPTGAGLVNVVGDAIGSEYVIYLSNDRGSFVVAERAGLNDYVVVEILPLVRPLSTTEMASFPRPELVLGKRHATTKLQQLLVAYQSGDGKVHVRQLIFHLSPSQPIRSRELFSADGYAPTLAIESTQEFVVAWMRQESGTNQPNWQVVTKKLDAVIRTAAGVEDIVYDIPTPLAPIAATNTALPPADVGGPDFQSLPVAASHPGAHPRLMLNPSQLRNPGQLYLVYTDLDTNTHTSQVKLLRSDAFGTDWNPSTVVPQVVHTSTFNQFQPAIAVNPTSGVLAISWYEETPLGPLTVSRVMVLSGDGGKTFSSAVALSSTPSTARATNLSGTAATFGLGNAQALAFDADQRIAAAWTDNSPATRDNPDVPTMEIAVGILPYVNIVPGTPKVVAVPFSGEAQSAIDVQIASFTGVTDRTESDFTANIFWGDGTSTPATAITATPGAPGRFDVRGNHSYASPGSYPIKVIVTDKRSGTTGATWSNASQLAGGQSETTIAVNPTDTNNLFTAAHNDGIQFSRDGGVSWKRSQFLEPDNSNPLRTGYVDPQTMFDSFGNLYFATLVTRESDRPIVIYLSSDGGETFHLLERLGVDKKMDYPGLASRYLPDDSVDRIGVVGWDEHTQGLFYWELTSHGVNSVDPHSLEVVVDDAYIATPSVTFDEEGRPLIHGTNVVGDPARGGNRTNLALHAPENVTDRSRFTTRSILSALTHGTVIPPVPCYVLPPPDAAKCRGVTPGGKIAYDSLRKQLVTVYLTAVPNGTLSQPRVFLQASSDQGASWTDPIAVFNSATVTDPGSYQFNPSLAIDPSNGDIAVGWYDTFGASPDDQVRYFIAVSGDGGKTFSEPLPVSEGFSDVTNKTVPVDPFTQANGFGDYTTLAFQGGRLFAAWADNCNELPNNPSPGQLDVAISRNVVAHIAPRALQLTPIVPATVPVRSPTRHTLLRVGEDSGGGIPVSRVPSLAARVNWGDGSPTEPADVERNPNTGLVDVSADHTYQDTGMKTITVEVLNYNRWESIVVHTEVLPSAIDLQGRDVILTVDTPLYGPVAYFTDTDPETRTGDYSSQVTWPDGSVAAERTIADGTQSLTSQVDVAHLLGPAFYALGLKPGTRENWLSQISRQGQVTPIRAVPDSIQGGLARVVNGLNILHGDFYGVGTDDRERLWLYRLGGTISPVMQLPAGLSGGLNSTGPSSGASLAMLLNRADGTAQMLFLDPQAGQITQTRDLGTGFYRGLTRYGDQWYAILEETNGVDQLIRVHPQESTVVERLFTLGTGFSGGISSGTFSDEGLLEPALYAVRTRPDGTTTWTRIGLDGHISDVRDLASIATRGYQVVAQYVTGTTSDSRPVAINLQDRLSRDFRAASHLRVVAHEFRAVPQQPQNFVFQGFDTGPITVAQFDMVGGPAATLGAYQATIDWRDGTVEPGGIAIQGRSIFVQGRHTYSDGYEVRPQVTLTDTTGNRGTATSGITVAPEVTSYVRPAIWGNLQDPTAKEITYHINLQSATASTLHGPFYLLFDLPLGATFIDPAHTVSFGDRQFYRLDDPRLYGTQNVSADVRVQFQTAPTGLSTPTIRVFDGPANGLGRSTSSALAFQNASLTFAANVGQAPAPVGFVARGTGYELWLSPTSASLLVDSKHATMAGFHGDVSVPVALRMELVDANPEALIQGVDRQRATFNYFDGHDASQWLRDVATFGGVTVKNVYAGIDLHYYSNAGTLEYDWIVSPHADASQIGWRFPDATNISIDAHGNVVFQLETGTLTKQSPRIYQSVNGEQRRVPGRYRVDDQGTLRFDLGAYQTDAPLIIDPLVVFSTYVGSPLGTLGVETGSAIATDDVGNAYVLGQTTAADFPALWSISRRYSVGPDAPASFVSKFAPNGQLIYTTFFGHTLGRAITVDPDGQVVFGGLAVDDQMATTNAFQTVFQGGPSRFFTRPKDGFVAKLSANGDQLLFASYIGNDTYNESVAALAIGPSGEVIVVNQLRNSSQQSGSEIVWISPTGDTLVRRAALRESSHDLLATSLAMAADGRLFVAGNALPLLDSGSGTSDPFVTGLDPVGSPLWFSILDENQHEGSAAALVLANNGHIYVGGTTRADRLESLNVVRSHQGDFDAFIAQLDAADGHWINARFLGGTRDDSLSGLDLDFSQRVIALGTTESSDLPLVRPFKVSHTTGSSTIFGQNLSDLFVTQLSNDLSTIEFSTYYGGSDIDRGLALAASNSGAIWITGGTGSIDFPTQQPFQPSLEGSLSYNAVVTRIDLAGPAVLDVSLAPISPTLNAPFNGLVARFTSNSNDDASVYRATIDWGDGTSSAATIQPSSAQPWGAFNLLGEHTYTQAGTYSFRVTVFNGQGTPFTQTSTTVAHTPRGTADYHIELDTSTVRGQVGQLVLQFNPGMAGQTLPATIQLSQWTQAGGGATSPQLTGDATGNRDQGIVLQNSSSLNEYREQLTFGESLQFDMHLSSDALRGASHDLLGSLFSVILLDDTNQPTPITVDPSGSIVRMYVTGDGATVTSTFLAQGSSVPVSPIGFAARVDVNPAALTGELVPFRATEGEQFSAIVGRFTDEGPQSQTSQFQAVIDWADGSPLDPGRIVSIGNGQFQVEGTHAYSIFGNPAVNVQIRAVDGRRLQLASGPVGPSVDEGVIATTSQGGEPRRFSSAGDLNGDAVRDRALIDDSSIVTVHVMDSSGAVTFSTTLSPLYATIPPFSVFDRSFVDVFVADWDGDRDNDIIATNNQGTWWFENQGTLAFNTAKPLWSHTTRDVVDINNDGLLELLANEAGQIRVGRADGSGGIVSERVYDLAFENTIVAVADENNDGLADVSTFVGAGNQRATLFGSPTDGFYTSAPIPGSRDATHLAVGDIDGDRQLDVVTAGQGKGYVVISLDFAHREFALSRPPRTRANPQVLDFLTTGDFDGDGRLETIMLRSSRGRPSIPDQNAIVVRSMGADGAVIRESVVSTQFLPSGPIVVGDVNGDQHTDLLFGTIEFSSSLTSLIHIFLGRGDLTFVEGASISLPGFVNFVQLADWNRDGTSDLIVGRNDETSQLVVEVLPGIRPGTFGGAIYQRTFGPSTFRDYLQVRDWNNDGDLDIVRQVAFGSIISPPFTRVNSFITILDHNDQERTIALYPGETPIIQFPVYGDWNHDGLTDEANIAFNDQTARPYRQVVEVRLGTVDGGLGAPQVIDLPQSNGTDGQSARLNSADLEGDGRLELIVEMQGIDLYLLTKAFTILQGDAAGRFSIGKSYQFLGDAADKFGIWGGTQWVDWDQDGLLDAVRESRSGLDDDGIQVVRGLGHGNFAAPQIVYLPPTSDQEASTSSGRVSLADMNGDGTTDLLVDERSGRLFIYPGDGLGHFATAVSLQLPSLPVPAHVILAEDFNGDGLRDLYLGGDTVYRNTGNLTFAVTDIDGSRTNPAQVNAHAGDFDRDGRLDLVTLSDTFVNGGSSSATLLVYRGQGNGQFHPPVAISISAGSDSLYVGNVSANDFNGDDILDLIFPYRTFSSPSGFMVLRGVGDGTFLEPSLTVVPAVPYRIATGDFDGDQRADVALMNYAVFGGSGFFTDVFSGHGQGSFTLTKRVVSGIQPQDILAPDVDGDGQNDLVIVDLRRNDGDPSSSVHYLHSPSNQQEAVEVAEAPLTPIGLLLEATVNVPFVGTIGQFNDASHLDTAGDFNVVLDWGDGSSPTTATAMRDPVDPNVFWIQGTHVYTHNGTFSIRSSVNYRDGSTAAVVSSIEVNNLSGPLLQSHGIDISATERIAFVAPVATFSDASGTVIPDAYSATIDWGDGVRTAAAIRFDAGVFTVGGKHRYDFSGTYNVRVEMMNLRGETAIATSRATVNANPAGVLQGSAITIETTENTPFTAKVAQFTTTDTSAEASIFRATIDWGDQTESPGFVRLDAPGHFSVDGSHVFTAVGTSLVRITVESALGQEVILDGVANIRDAVVELFLVPISAIVGEPVRNPVAHFVDADIPRDIAEYDVTIDWGDGSITSGTITANPPQSGEYDISGVHTYSNAATHVVTVTLTEPGGIVTAQGTADVRTPDVVIDSRPISDFIRTEPVSYVVASFSRSLGIDVESLRGLINWGDGSVSTAQFTLQDTSIDVTGSHNFVRSAQFPVTVTIGTPTTQLFTVRTEAQIIGPQISSSQLSLTAMAGVPWYGVVSDLAMSPRLSADTLRATIVWLDGVTSAGAIITSATAQRDFDVLGSFTFEQPGVYSVGIELRTDSGELLGTSASSFSVMPAIVEPLALATTGPHFVHEREPLQLPIARLVDALPNATVRYTVTIDWADGSITAGTVVQVPGRPTQYEIHEIDYTYQYSGTYDAEIRVTNALGTRTSVTTRMIVSPWSLVGIPVGITAREEEEFDGLVGQFRTDEVGATAGNYCATIDWSDEGEEEELELDGDASPAPEVETTVTAAEVIADPLVPGLFRVEGDHEFRSEGRKNIHIRIMQRRGANQECDVDPQIAFDSPADVFGRKKTESVLVGGTLQVPIREERDWVIAHYVPRRPEVETSDLVVHAVWSDGRTASVSMVADPVREGHFDIVSTTSFATLDSVVVQLQVEYVSDVDPASTESTTIVPFDPIQPPAVVPDVQDIIDDIHDSVQDLVPQLTADQSSVHRRLNQTASMTGTWKRLAVNQAITTNMGSVTRNADGTWIWHSPIRLTRPASTQTIIITAANRLGQVSEAGFDLIDDREELTPGIVVTPVSGLVTTERGGVAEFHVVLTAPPTSDVGLRLYSSNPKEGVISRSLVTFTPLNWDVPQGITVTGVADRITDGAIAYRIITAWATSEDRRYHGINPDEVLLISQDDDGLAAMTISNSVPAQGVAIQNAATVDRVFADVASSHQDDPDMWFRASNRAWKLRKRASR